MAEKQVTTNELLEFMQENMVTKEDAKSFATKDDLKAFLTKEDAKAFLTKKDAKAFLTKEDAKAFLTKEDAKAFATKDDFALLKLDIKDIQENMATKDDLREVKDELTGQIDGLVTMHRKHDAEISAIRNRCGRIERHVGM